MQLQSPIVLFTGFSMASALASAAQSVYKGCGYCIEAEWTTSGTLGGVLELRASVGGSVFNALVGSPITLTGAGSWLWIAEAGSCQYNYVQLVYAPASGDSGLLSALYSY
jgi:hypothetical protein